VNELALALQDVNACASFECITSFNGDHGYINILISSMFYKKDFFKLYTAC
jgi:hypothetical protein